MFQRDISQKPFEDHQRLESQQVNKALRREGSQKQGESSHNTGFRGEMEPEREYSNSSRLTRSRPTQLSSGFTPLRIQQNSGQESPFLRIPGSFQEKNKTSLSQRKKE
ncbi:hypothetical protein O181_098879 [Austropuccinia psidii MF-1]|uniref:Uncharacterized protein n=1 Tax=Austropuccinia psidii MF-1 TaxID=1389203 RepID=A0A9Q3JC54_9BASI|nr:hypothetical protein [Austropuccinia psidii MF-1]